MLGQTATPFALIVVEFWGENLGDSRIALKLTIAALSTDLHS
jgi:hypothetical protein